MRFSPTEVRLRRLLATAPNQTNKVKLAHHVWTLNNTFDLLKQEADGKAELQVYHRAIADLASQVEDITGSPAEELQTEDNLIFLGLDESGRTNDNSSFSVQHEIRADSPLFPSCLKRKYSPDMDVFLDDHDVRAAAEELRLSCNRVGKRVCVDEAPYEENGVYLANKVVRGDLGRKKRKSDSLKEESDGSVGFQTCFSSEVGNYREGEDGESSLTHEGLNPAMIHTAGGKSLEEGEDETTEVLEWDPVLQIREQQVEQDKVVNDMLSLTKQIKERSLLLGNSLRNMKVLVESSEMTIAHCLSVTMAANAKTDVFGTRSEERGWGSVTWFSLLLMYLVFLSVILLIRLT